MLLQSLKHSATVWSLDVVVLRAVRPCIRAVQAHATVARFGHPEPALFQGLRQKNDTTKRTWTSEVSLR